VAEVGVAALLIESLARVLSDGRPWNDGINYKLSKNAADRISKDTEELELLYPELMCCINSELNGGRIRDYEEYARFKTAHAVDDGFREVSKKIEDIVLRLLFLGTPGLINTGSCST